MRRIPAVLIVTLALLLGAGSSSTTAQAPVHTFTGFPTDFLLDGSEVTLPFLLIAQTPAGVVLAQATVDPCCQWSFEVPVRAGASQVVFVLSEPKDPSLVRGTSEPLAIEPGGRTDLRVLRFQSGPSDRFREVPPVRGRAGQGQVLTTPPVPTAEQIRIREAGLAVANPDELSNTFAGGPVAPPRIPPSQDLLDVDDFGPVTAGCGERTVQLHEGFNLVGYTGSGASVVDATATIVAPGGAVGLPSGRPTTFLFDSRLGEFSRNDARLPAALNGFDAFSSFDGVWVNVDDPAGASWTIPIASNDPRAVDLDVSWNIAVWTGPDGTAPPVAFRSILDVLEVAFAEDNSAFRPQGPALFNTMRPLAYGTALWLKLTAPGTWLIPAADIDCAGGSELPDFPPTTDLVVQSLPRGGAELETSAAGDFTVFRSTEVLQGTNTSRIGEPTAANNRNVMLYTGNWHAAVSTDEGQTWGFIDPTANGFPPPARGGAFCCDQLTSFDDDTGMLFWLLQYQRDGNGDNAVRVVVYQTKNDIESQTYCTYDFTPQTFGAAGSRWFDFNGMQASNDWLYVTSNQYEFDPGPTASSSDDSSSLEGGIVWRLELADFAGGCGGVTTQYYFNDTYYGTPLAASGSTMYWGVHSGGANNAIEIGRATDGSTTVTRWTRSISTFPTSNKGDLVCTAPDGTNPCARLNSRLKTAWASNGQLGFMWSAAQDPGSGWDFPHTRVAIFRTSDMTLVSEPHIWNGDFAWVMATVGKNSRGDIAGPIYIMGGGKFPKAKAIIWDADSGTPAPWENRTLRTGNDAPDGKGTGAEAVGRFGDYGGSIAYDNCRATWLVAFYTMQDGGTDNDAEHRVAWIGRERDGCADLVVSALAFAVIADSSPKQLLIAESTKNIGSASASASTTRYYLSRDRNSSANDVLLDATHVVPALAADDFDGQLELGTVPGRTGPGEYYLIACADDLEVAAEITQTNNCTASESQVTITLDRIIVGPIIIPWLPTDR